MFSRFMKIVPMLFMFSAIAEPQWQQWGTGNDSIWYVMKDGIAKQGGTTEVWMMADFSKPQRTVDGEIYQSMKVREVFDCNEQKKYRSAMILFPGRLGSGGQIYSYDGYIGSSEKFAPDDWVSRGYGEFCKKSWQFWK